MNKLNAVFLTTALASAAAVSAQTPETTSPQGEPPNQQTPSQQGVASSETRSESGKAVTSEEFVKRAAQSNLAEIKVSELAQRKASSPEVKQYAQQMISDHTKANTELARLAQSQNIEVPDDTDLMHKASMKLLQTKSGEEFDTAYMEQMDKDHKKAVELFESASSSPKVDKELQAFASKMLPKLHEHHEQVAQIESKQPKASASAESSSSRR